jgi:hypothetical protein
MEKLNTLNKLLRSLGFVKEAQEVDQLSGEYLYSFVPTDSLDSVKEHGIASSKHIKENEELLNEIFPEEKERDEWLDRYDSEDITLQGPNVFFQKPDLDMIKSLDKDHILFDSEFTLAKIDYKRIKEDLDGVSIFGLELIPYKDSEYDSKKDTIEHTLTESEVSKEMSKSSEEAWSDYSNSGGYFAPNVPHGVLLLDGDHIPSKYLTFE